METAFYPHDVFHPQPPIDHPHMITGDFHGSGGMDFHGHGHVGGEGHVEYHPHPNVSIGIGGGADYDLHTHHVGNNHATFDLKWKF